jgi:hypothetical protein
MVAKKVKFTTGYISGLSVWLACYIWNISSVNKLTDSYYYELLSFDECLCAGNNPYRLHITFLIYYYIKT